MHVLVPFDIVRQKILRIVRESDIDSVFSNSKSVSWCSCRGPAPPRGPPTACGW